MRILLIEDDKDTAQTVKEELQNYFVVEIAHTGEDGEYRASINEYDLIILDYMLPGLNGIDVCKKIRETNNEVPILMLTGNDDIPTKVIAFNEGADDYLIKPFNFDELLARIRALLRRPRKITPTSILRVEDLEFDVNKKTVTRRGTPIVLRRKEMYLLEYLMRNVGHVITREMILSHVWDSEKDSFTNTIDVHIKYLRDRIDKNFNKKLIKTVYGLGYKIEG